MVNTFVPGPKATPLWPGEALEIAGVLDSDLPSLTYFPLPGDTPTAAIVVAPGGGYHLKAEHEGAPIAEWLNNLGIAAFVVDYRVAPHRHPAPLQDAQRAIRLVRARAAEWNVDPNRVGILGFSAGGHLTATASTLWDRGDAAASDSVARESSRPDVAVLCYPVISQLENPHIGSLENLVGPGPDHELVKLLSSEQQVNAETPPSFIWHTADDAVVDVQHSLRYASALGTHGVPFSLHVFPRGRHGLGLAADDPTVSAWTSLAAQFLHDQGFRS